MVEKSSPSGQSDRAALEVRHDAVPGRLRIALAGLRHHPERAGRLIEAVAARAPAWRIEANTRTGTLLVQYPPEQASAAILTLLADAWASQETAPPVSPAPALPDAPDAAWHSPADSVLASVASHRSDGLNSDEARTRLAHYGPNAVAGAPPPSWINAAKDQLLTVPVGMLGASAAFSAATGARADALAIGSVIGLNTVIGVVTEQRAEAVIAGLQSFGNPRCTVRRDGEERSIDADQLVPGDILVLQRGSFIGADARLLVADDLTIDEAMLTGESTTVRKRADVQLPADTPLAERCNMVFRGSAITGGSGLAVVTATGAQTESGRIQCALQGTSAPTTPLFRELDRLGGRLALVFAAACGVVFLAGVARGFGTIAMIRMAASIAVASVPEGLPAVATTTLALGVAKMRHKGVLIRKLGAVEALGEVQTLCFDKTGTLTENRMALAGADLGAGFVAHDALASSTALARLLATAVLASEARIDGRDGALEIDGSSTERALIEGALAHGVAVAELIHKHPRCAFVGRSESAPWIVSRHRTSDGGVLIAVKGSPGFVLEQCGAKRTATGRQPLDAASRTAILEANDAMAARGLRVLGVARGFGDASDTGREAAALEWLGLVALADPIRSGMAGLMADFHRSGVATVMITGDQSGTAYAIGQALGLSGGAALRSLDSRALDKLHPATLSAIATRTDVFARVSPAQKLAIVQALQGAGKVVAMTGDGINDSPALKAADIGIAMGRDGTDAARAVADIVLEADDLTMMRTAMAEGRAIYDNIQRAVDFLVATNLSEIGLTAMTTLGGLPQPLTPLQLLWLNLVSDVFPGLALAVQPADDEVLARPPRAPGTPILSRQAFARLARQGGLLTAASALAYLDGLRRYGPSVQARALTLNALVAGQLLHAYSVRAGTERPIWRDTRPRSPALDGAVLGTLALQALAPLVPGLRPLFGFTTMRARDWLTIGLCAAGPLLINELIKQGGSTRRSDHAR
ncbi:MAG: HAD-IC family P-type ATPase [Geminicoccaceae bacterium]